MGKSESCLPEVYFRVCGRASLGKLGHKERIEDEWRLCWGGSQGQDAYEKEAMPRSNSWSQLRLRIPNQSKAKLGQ